MGGVMGIRGAAMAVEMQETRVRRRWNKIGIIFFCARQVDRLADSSDKTAAERGIFVPSPNYLRREARERYRRRAELTGG